MLSDHQRNRVALSRFTGASPAANHRIAIELQDYANRIQEHWRAAHDGLHPPTRARGVTPPGGYVWRLDGHLSASQQGDYPRTHHDALEFPEGQMVLTDQPA